MFSGLQEILILVLIGLAIFFLPRIGQKIQPQNSLNPLIIKAGFLFSGKMRLAIIISIIWPLFIAYFVKPWQNGLEKLFYFGLAPVFIGWSIRWIIAGYKKTK